MGNRVKKQTERVMGVTRGEGGMGRSRAGRGEWQGQRLTGVEAGWQDQGTDCGAVENWDRVVKIKAVVARRQRQRQQEK